MSTNSNCLFVQTKPNEWFYVLEDRNAPNNTWDWREFATGYGPFEQIGRASRDLLVVGQAANWFAGGVSWS